MNSNSSNEYYDKKIRSAQTFLSRWKNSNGKIWDFQSSLLNITLRFEKDDFKGNFHFICIEPFEIHGSFKWKSEELIIEYDEVDDKITVKEKNGYILIYCHDFEIKENVKPVF